MKTFHKSLRWQALKIFNLKKEKSEVINKKNQQPYENLKICSICRGKFEHNNVSDKKCCEVRDHCHYTGEYTCTARIICNGKYLYLKKLP